MIVQVNVVLNRTIVVVVSTTCAVVIFRVNMSGTRRQVNGSIKGIAKNIILEEGINYTAKQTQARMDKLEED